MNLLIEEIFERNLWQIDNLSDLPIAKIYDSLDRDKFACIRGIISPVEVEIARKNLSSNFQQKSDRPTIGKSPEEVQSNFQKLSVGVVHGKSHANNYGRLLRTFYNPLWAEDIYQMHSIFRRMIIVKNKLLGKPDNFASDKIEEELWTAARIHQYPTGGGFMQEHRDRTLVNVSQEMNLNYFQVLLIMSQKGIDFERGGSFIEHQGKRISFEDYCQLGDIVIYDGQTLHGVEDIDAHKLLNLDIVCGRLAAFVSLFTVIYTPPNVNFQPFLVEVIHGYLQRQKETEYIITSWLDNDDAIAINFIETIQQNFHRQEFEYLNFPYGFQLRQDGLYLREYLFN